MVDKMADNLTEAHDRNRVSAVASEQDASTLLPMLIAGLALVMIGMITVVLLV